MNVDKLRFINDPFYDILQMSLDGSSSDLKDSGLNILLDSIDYPTISKKDIPQIKEKIENGLTYKEILDSLNINISYSPTYLQGLTKSPSDEKVEISAKARYILYTYIGWTLSQEKKINFNNISSILGSLNLCLHTPYSVIASNAFLRALLFYTIEKKYVNVHMLYQNIINFYIESDTLENEHFLVLQEFLASVTENLYQTQPKSVLDLFLSIRSIIEVKGNQFTQAVIDNILVTVGPFIKDLLPEALLLLEEIFPLLTLNQKLLYVSQAVNTLVDLVKSSDKKVILNSKENTKLFTLSIKATSKPKFEFNNTTTFGSGLDFPNDVLIDDPEEIFNFIDKSIIEKMRNVTNIFAQTEETIIEFQKSIQEKVHEDITLFVFFVCSLAEIESRKIKTQDFSNVLFSSQVFNPCILCQQKFEDTKELNVIRNACFRIILDLGEKGILNGLEFFMNLPFMLAEFLCRCINNGSTVLEIIQTSNEIISKLIKIILLYQKANFEGIYDIEGPRLAILLFLSQVFTDVTCEDYFFNNPDFVFAYFSLAFEEPLQPVITGHIRSYLTKPGAINCPLVGVAISNITENLKVTFPDPRSISLINKLVIAMNEALSHQHQIGDQLVVACASISLSLSMTDASQHSKEFLLNCMTLFAVCSHVFTLDENQKSILEAAIVQCFGTDPPKLVFEKLMQIISGDDLGYRHPSFYIRQPVALSIIFNVFSESPLLFTLIEFLDSLCRNVPANTVECHVGGIDLLVLEYLNKRWYGDSLTPEFVDACFGLLRKIAVVSSSVTIIHRFVSLLCPLENKFIPDYFSKVLSTMINIVAATLNTPRAAIPLDYTNVYEIPDRFPLTDGFTIAFWLKVENPSPRYVPNLLKAMDGDKLVLHIYMNNNVVHFYQRSNKVESTAFIDKELNINEWTFLVINYEIVEDSAIINVYNNCIQAPKFKFPIPKATPLRFIAGGLDEPPAPKTLFTSLGGIVLYKNFNFELINRINQHGPAQLDRESEKPNFVFIPEVDFENKPTSLGYVLATHSKIPSIIPAFSVVNLKYKNGESGGLVADQVVELLSNALLMCEEAEKEFSNSRGFAMISHLLLECDNAAITYQVYIRFFSLLQMLRTKELQKQLFLDILINIHIWIVADKTSLLRILRHWARVLLPATKHTCASSLQFTDLLNDYVLYMWEEPVDQYAQGTAGTVRERRADVDVKACSHTFCDCLLIQSHVNFNEQCMKLLVSHILCCKDTLQKTHLIELLRQMALATPTPFEMLSDPDSVIPTIHKLMSIKSDLANITAINAIIRIHKVCQCQRLLSQDIDILIHEIEGESINEILLVLLENEIKSGFPETLPILFWVAMYLGENRVLATLDHIKPSKVFTEKDEWWFFWPLICATAHPKCADKILDFVTQCNHKDWKRILALLCQLTNVFGLTRDHLLNSFIVSLSTILCRNDNISEEDFDAYFGFIWELMLQIPIESTPLLFRTFKGSEFQCDYEPIKPKAEPKPDRLVRGFDYIRYFCDNLSEQPTKVGFRFNDNDDWIDGDLALIVMNTFSAVKYWKALDLDLYICSRILYNNPNNVIQHIDLLEIPKEVANEHQMGIDYIFVKMDTRGIQCPIEHFKSRSAISNYHQFTEKVSQYSTEEKSKLEIDFINEVKQYQNVLNKTLEDTEKVSISNEFTLSSLATTVSDFQTANESNMSMWNRMWEGLTIDTAPWSKSIPPRSVIFRDTIMCGHFMMPRLIHKAPKSMNRIASEFSLATFGNSIKEISVDQEKPVYSTSGQLISPSGDRPVTFNVYTDKISVTAFDGVRREISQNEVDFVMSRKIWHRPTAVEIFRTCGRTMLIQFSEAKPQDIITRINAMHPNSGLGAISVHTDLWKKRMISNFEYLMIVNLISGRSNNCIFQYPIFPWVIADYDSETLDLTKPETFRDLTKPMYAEHEKGKRFKKAQLSSHDVCGYLHSLMPYKRLALNYNRNIVNSIPEAFAKSRIEGTEVVPEMYYMHEFFDDFKLPKWAKSSIDFVQKMAAALESDYVSENLPAWIDLTFGYLQQSETPVYNLYEQTLYEDIWNSYEELGISKDEVIKAKKNEGQIPPKLFRKPHPHRDPIGKVKNVDTFIGFPTGTNPVDYLVELTEDPMQVFVHVLGSDGNVTSLNISLSEQEIFTYNSEQSSICGHTSRAFLLSKDFVVRCGGNVLLHNQNVTATIANCSAQCFAKSPKSFIFVSADAMVSMYDIETASIKKQIPFYSGEATCCDISDVHKMAAIGALRGDIIIHSTTSANFLSVVKLGSATPLFVRITKKTGHLIVHTSEMQGPRTIYSVSALTLNGDLISKETVKYEFISMFCSSTSRNLDFVICATKTGVYVATVPNLKFTQVFIGTEAIVSADYIETMRSIVILTSQGNVILKRYIPEDTI